MRLVHEVQFCEHAVHLVCPLMICSNSPMGLQEAPQELVLVERTNPGLHEVQISDLEIQVAHVGSQVSHDWEVAPSDSLVAR